MTAGWRMEGRSRNKHNSNVAPGRGEEGQEMAHPLSTLAAPQEAHGLLGLPWGASLVSFCKLLPDKKG